MGDRCKQVMKDGARYHIRLRSNCFLKTLLLGLTRSNNYFCHFRAGLFGATLNDFIARLVVCGVRLSYCGHSVGLQPFFLQADLAPKVTQNKDSAFCVLHLGGISVLVGMV